ncbi:MAG: hypothetical protein QOH63_2016 [Acidobacteriota bacterium]|jgi:hypothetical protein|nr:hypothetical protein [Acidobacteriota bacterium]
MPATGTSFSVDLLVVTPDQKRKIDFKLSKDFKDDGSVLWTMVFSLQERAKTTDAFADVVQLTVTIKPANHKKAEATANNGLDDAQTSAALDAADTAKAFTAGEVSKATAQADARRVIAVRGA